MRRRSLGERRMTGGINHLRWLAGCALLLGLTFSAYPQEPPPQSDHFTFRGEPVDLNQWLEKLEKQNAELTRQLQELQSRPARAGETSSLATEQMEQKKKEAQAAAKAQEAKKDAAVDKAFVVGENLKMHAVWKNGMIWQSTDKAFKFS